MSSVEYSIPVSDEEKALAKEVRAAFSDVLKRQEFLTNYLDVFFGHLEEISSSSNIVKLGPLIKRYEHKLKKVFNVYIKSISKAFNLYEQSFSDTEMDEIRDLIIEYVRGVRESILEIVKILQEIDSASFINEAQTIYSKLSENLEKVDSAIRVDWFGHLDYNILGKIKLGSIPLSIK